MEKRSWVGRYGYTFDEDTRYFSFEMNASFQNGSFEGDVHEEEFSGLTSDTVHIKGFIEEDMISFVKTYPYFWTYDDQGNIIMDKEKKGHEVVYEGYFDEGTGSWSGQWEVLMSEEKTYPGQYKQQFIIGPWDMKRKADQ